MTFSLPLIQSAISKEKLDAWLFYDFQRSNSIAHRILNVDPQCHLTRRWFYLVPAAGEPVKILHRIENFALQGLPGQKREYASRSSMTDELALALKGMKKVAMEYSPHNAIPYISKVDAGTVEMVRSLGVNIESSGNLISLFESTCSDEQEKSHERAAAHLRRIVEEAFNWVARRIEKDVSTDEYSIQSFIIEAFDQASLITNARPVVAANKNSGDPHYSPSQKRNSPVTLDDFLLIDLWAKETKADSIYADITWTCYLGERVPERIEKVFHIVRKARDAALEFVQVNFEKGRAIAGYEVDQAARQVIEKEGYGPHFVHRTGHNIGIDVHGPGTHMDGFETKDERLLLPHTCFSIEPGIYLPEFGVRSEIDVFLTEREVRVYGQPIQESVFMPFSG